MSIGANFGNRDSDRDGPSCPEGEVQLWCVPVREAVMLPAQRKCVDRATLNALINAQKCVTTGRFRFARVEPDCHSRN
jgi:hypothetical protein